MRTNQIQNLATTGDYFSKNTEKFDMVIDHNDEDFNQVPEDPEEEVTKTPEKRKPEPIPKEYQAPQTEAKPSRLSKQNDITPKKPKKEKSQSPIRKLEVESNEHLLSEWEKKYGSKKDREFYKNQEKTLNEWGEEVVPQRVTHQREPSRPDPPSPTVEKETEDTQPKEFEYDWDNEDKPEVQDKMKKKKSRKNKKSLNHSRVPMGAMTYADADYN